MTKAEIISRLSNMSDQYGALLLELMDTYHASNLRDITTDQAREFWERRIVCKADGSSKSEPV